jgi:hypothetical protein
MTLEWTATQPLESTSPAEGGILGSRNINLRLPEATFRPTDSGPTPVCHSPRSLGSRLLQHLCPPRLTERLRVLSQAARRSSWARGAVGRVTSASCASIHPGGRRVQIQSDAGFCSERSATVLRHGAKQFLMGAKLCWRTSPLSRRRLLIPPAGRRPQANASRSEVERSESLETGARSDS